MSKISKVVYGNQTLIDLTSDTVTADKLLEGYTAHGADGENVVGTCTYDADTSDATASEGEILANKTAYVNGAKVVGTMTNRGSVSGIISSKDDSYAIQSGYHDGSGTVEIDSTEKSKIIAGNIKSGVEILGVVGTYEGGGGGTGQAKTATPYTTSQVITPDVGYDYLTQVTVNDISYSEVPNAGGGLTATIGDVAP